MTRWTIRRRFLATILGFATALALLVQLYWVPRQIQVLVEAQTEEISGQLDVIVDGLLPMVLANENAAIADRLNSVKAGHKTWTRVALYREDGRQVYPTTDFGAVPDPDQLNLSAQLTHDGIGHGRVDISVDIRATVQKLINVQRNLGISALLILLVSIAAMTWSLDRFITRRLSKLADAADQLALGNFHATLPAASGDEVGRLTESFAAMRRQIAHKAAALDTAREQAEAALGAKSRFLATMSHEIRTPLNAVIPVAEMLATTDLTREQHHHIETIQQAGQTLLSIVDDILDITRFEEGRLMLRMAPLSLPNVVESVINMLWATASTKRLALTFDIAPELDRVLNGDADRIRQILINLVGNAIKFTETGSVTLRCGRISETADTVRIWIEVQDTGIGIPKDAQDRIFERFEQADNGRTRRYGGSGLGLAITKMLVEAHDGDIFLRHTSDKGTNISCSLTLFKPAPEDMTVNDKIPTSLNPSKLPERLSAFRALVVDDSPVNLEVAKAMLSNLGFEVQTAIDGAEAVDLVESAEFDVVLMDMHMPRMDGLEATRRIRQLTTKAANTHIIALTASVLQEDIDQCFDAGMNGFLSKPLTRARVREQVMTACQP